MRYYIAAHFFNLLFLVNGLFSWTCTNSLTSLTMLIFFSKIGLFPIICIYSFFHTSYTDHDSLPQISPRLLLNSILLLVFSLIPQNKIKIDPPKPNKTEKKSPKQNKIKSPQNNTQTSLCLGQLPLAMGPALDCG